MSSAHDLARQHTGEIEIGFSEALNRHVTRHVVPAPPVSQRKIDFEHRRPRIMRECLAEATGVFFYVFPGIASVASTYLNATGASPTTFGSIFQIGWAFAIGIAFAIITCAPTSGGHFNPAITICFAIWQGFPWKKVPHYILSQIFGAFIAGCLMIGCYWPEIQVARAAEIAKEGTTIFNGGVASIPCVIPNPNQTNQGFLFLQEFFVDFYIGIVIWACLDPANPFVAPASVPFTIGIAYAAMVWGFAANTISTNLARDLGTRLASAAFFGRGIFTVDNGYSWISILVNIPATIAATGYYEFLMRDSLQKIQAGHATHEHGEMGLMKHLSSVGADVPDEMQREPGYLNGSAAGANGQEVKSKDFAGLDQQGRLGGAMDKASSMEEGRGY